MNSRPSRVEGRGSKSSSLIRRKTVGSTRSDSECSRLIAQRSTVHLSLLSSFGHCAAHRCTISSKSHRSAAARLLSDATTIPSH